MRWSEGWTEATLERLAEKYSIPPEDSGLRVSVTGLDNIDRGRELYIRASVVCWVLNGIRNFADILVNLLEKWRNLR